MITLRSIAGSADVETVDVASSVISDSELLDRIRSGDEQACERFVREHTGCMLAVASRFFSCEHDAADAVQDAFACAFDAIDSFQGHSRVSTWLHRIVVNACLMKLRAKKNRRGVSIEALLPAFDETGHHRSIVQPWRESVGDRLCIEETRAHVRACIDRLPESYRTVMLLRDIEEYDTEETARLLGCSPANVKTRLHRARQALRTLLDPMMCDAPADESLIRPHRHSTQN